MRGRCAGQASEFEVASDFASVACRHCASCKKISGGVGTANGRLRTETIRLLAGEDLVRTYQPDEGTAKTFCSVCGSNLFGGGWPDSGFPSARLSASESPFTQRPDAHLSVRSLAP